MLSSEQLWMPPCEGLHLWNELIIVTTRFEEVKSFTCIYTTANSAHLGRGGFPQLNQIDIFFCIRTNPMSFHPLYESTRLFCCVISWCVSYCNSTRWSFPPVATAWHLHQMNLPWSVQHVIAHDGLWDPIQRLHAYDQSCFCFYQRPRGMRHS